MAVVSVVNMKGGVGKTTLAVNLADVLVEREDCRVLLIDIDPQFNATQCLISAEDYVDRRRAGGHTIVDIFDDSPAAHVGIVAPPKAQKAIALEEVQPWTVKPSVDLLAGNLELYRLEMAPGQGREQRLKRFTRLRQTLKKYDFVIIDTPPTPSHWMTAALLASKYYIVPVKPDPISRIGIDLLRTVVDRYTENYGHTIECIGVVMTMVEANTIVYRDSTALLEADKIWRGKIFSNALPKRTKIAKAQGEQRLILEAGDDISKRAIAGIGQEFLEKINGR